MSTSIRLATILQTDLVGSTRLATAVGPNRADALRDEHFLILREAIASSKGHEVKTTGDGLVVAFLSASAAVQCAVAMQQLLERSNRHSDQPLHIRIGLGAGESTLRDGDYFGMPSIEAARLCEKAPPDGILVSSTVRMLAGHLEGTEFMPSGKLELKGFPEPMHAFAVGWQPLADETPRELASWPLPSELPVSRLSYVGRRAERERLADALSAARGGERRVVLLSGEPGIGKTRLAAFAVQSARAEGFALLWGACSEELAVPYAPWVGVCGQLVAHSPQELLESYVLRFGGELGRVAPNLSRRVPDLPPPQPSDPETERFLLFAAVAGLMQRASESFPLCLVLDDLQWADGQTAVLLKHVARAVNQSPLLILCTYRDSDLTPQHPLTGVLADLSQLPGVEQIALKGLGADEVAEMISTAAGHELDRDGVVLAAEITAKTAGNPFFVGEILRSLAETDTLLFDEDVGRWRIDRTSPIRLPQSVRDVIRRRVRRLGEETRILLTLAAVIGQSFDVGLMSRLADISEPMVLDRLEAAAAASLLVESTDRIGQFGFAHALISQCLYEELGATRRGGMHARIALALEQVATSEQPRLAELALHWRLANSPDAPRKAANYSRRAGHAALAGLAPAEAARLFRIAVELLEGAETEERCEALVGLGESQRQLGDGAYRATLLEAAELASHLGSAELAASAALANTSGTYSVIGEIDNERLQAIERALELDDPPVPARRARLLALEAQELSWDHDVQRRRGLANEALALARRAGEPRALAAVLRNAVLSHSGPDTLELRAQLGRELLTGAIEAQDPALEFWAHVVHFNVMVEQGEFGAAESALREMETVASRLGQPLLSWNVAWSQAGWALPRGDLAAAERAIEHALEVGQHAGEPNAVLIYGAQLAHLRAYQGRVAEILPVLEQSVAAFPSVSGWRAGLASAYSLVGRRDEAAAIVERAAADGFTDVLFDQGRTTALALYADATFEGGLRRPAAILYDLIEPWADQVAWNGASIYGHARMWLGLLAATLDRHDSADRHLAFACAFHESNGLLLWEIRGHLGWADALVNRGEPTRARQSAARALTLARAHGYGAFEARAAALAESTARA